MKLIVKIYSFFILVILTVVLLVGIQLSRLYYFGSRTDKIAVGFQRINPQADLKILFLGDSTAVGTGAQNNLESTAGRFGQEFPNAQIINISKNGWKIKDLLEHFPINQKADLVVIQIGGNDILRLTDYKTISQQLSQLVFLAKQISTNIIILHSGNVGTAPFFSWPFDLFYTQRTRDVRKIYLDHAQKEGFVYVDLFQERKDDIFLKDINHYYSADYLHPNGQGYKYWYDKIREAMSIGGINI